MKVVQIFRKKNAAFFSIENVFDRVNKELRESIEVFEFYLIDFGFSFRNIGNLFSLRRREKNSIFHVTGDVHYSVLFIPLRKSILTIHDCVFLEQQRGLKKVIVKWLYLDLPVVFCNHITTISEKSKSEIISYTKCDPGKVSVIPNPVSSGIKFIEKEFNFEMPSILFVGVTPNKNFERVCRALIGINCILVIVGKLSEEYLNMLSECCIRFEEYFSLSEEEMALRYAMTDIVLFPSLYEGFGLPIVEGFQAGRVVITSNISPMREISNGGACLVNPESVESIRKGIVDVIKDAAFRKRLILRGLEVAQEYGSKHIAKQYLNIYRKVSGL